LRTLVLLPGLDGTDVLFRPLLRAAPAGVQAVTVTYPPGRANTYEDLLPRVRAALPQDRPFHLLGWSFSGPLALMAAAEHPPRLRSVILVSSFAARPVPIVPRWARHLAHPALFRLFPAMSRARLFLSGRSREIGSLVREALAAAGPAAISCRARATLAVDARAALAACPVPLLYIRARSDGVIRKGAVDDIRRGLPSAAIVDVDGPHLALAIDPAAAWAALQDFMDRVESEAAAHARPPAP
jgi:pimeloyl-ACP methyl ester carboxylesterase